MKTSSRLTNKGFMAIFMSRSRKLLRIWPIEYSGGGSRGLQTVSASLKSLPCIWIQGLFQYILSKPKLLVWIHGHEWVRTHKSYDLTPCTITKLYMVFLFKNPHRSKNDIFSFWIYTWIICLVRDKWSFGWEHFSDASSSPCFPSKYKSLGATIASLFGQQP